MNMMHDLLYVSGRVRIDVLDAVNFTEADLLAFDFQDQAHAKKILQTYQHHNKVVQVGRDYLGSILKGSKDPPTDIAVGTGGSAPVDGNTGLQTEVFRGNITQRLDISNGIRFRFLLTSSSGNGNTLVEAGIFGPSPHLLLLARTVYDAIIKTSSVAVNYTWDLTFAHPT